jgi:3-hydroxyisobutyrate dehydrogenase
MMNAIICEMMGEALVFGERAGLDWNQMLEIFANSAPASPLLKYKAEELKTREFNATFTVKLMERDVDLMLDVARKSEMSLPVLALVRQLYAAARATGRGDLDVSAVLLMLEEMAGLPAKVGI